MSSNESISSTNLESWYQSQLEEKCTRSVSFENKTQEWHIDWWAYEVRQKNNLPPRSGYVEYTGIVVGGTDNNPGQLQTAYLQVKVLGDFTDCGLVNCRHKTTGKLIPAFNFDDRIAGQGKYYATAYYAIADKPNFGSGTLGWEFEGVLENGTIDKFEGIFMETINF
jgi:hypothetical protein